MDDSEARDILREHGETVSTRGKLATAAKGRATEYPAAGDTYTDGTAPDDFTSPGETVAGDPPDTTPALPPERPPRRVRAPRRGPTLKERLSGTGKDKGKKRHPRVRVDGLISSAWAAMGGLAGQIDPPLGRTLVMQAPVAGLILEDVVKGTAADRVLQPIARAEEKAEKVLALLAPPAIIVALEASQTLPPEQRQVREAILIPLLRRSLVLWVKIAGDKADEMITRAAEEGPAQEQADKLLAMILAPAVPNTPQEPVSADTSQPAA